MMSWQLAIFSAIGVQAIVYPSEEIAGFADFILPGQYYLDIACLQSKRKFLPEISNSSGDLFWENIRKCGLKLQHPLQKIKTQATKIPSKSLAIRKLHEILVEFIIHTKLSEFSM
ncbi:MAG: hypothetical protein EA411_12765 [Saprospirales bacterium]|nr:MAG: hypothetical protein EA411_12765 [Saprospirales bacterium]